MGRLGNYELVREIGEGGMSTVYEALDARLGRKVALKVLTVPPYLSQTQREKLVARLNREARAAGRLNHPNVVTIYDVGEAEGHHFIAMERLEGTTLRARLEDGPLPPEEASQILDQIAGALDTVQAQGVLHRDIKPSNVMLLPDGRVKLTDFGVARLVDDATVTHAGATIGSPAYTAPEQVRGEKATPATDRWALGVLLYEMLAGRAPFTGDHVASVLHQVAYDAPPPLPPALEPFQPVLDQALAKDPKARYGSARELASAFRDALRAPTLEPSPGLRETTSVGAKGGVVAAALPRRRRLPAWAWLLPLAALLGVIPFLLRRPEPTRAVRPAASPAHSPAPVLRSPVAAQPRPVTVTERSSQSRGAPTATENRKPKASTQARPKRPVSIVRVAPRPARASAELTHPRHRRRRPATQAAATVSPPAAAHAEVPRRSRLVRTEREPRSQPDVPARVSHISRPRSEDTGRLPGSASGLNDRGYRLLRQGRHRDAEPLLREAVRRNPNYAYAQYNLGWSLLEQGKAREALPHLQRTAAQQPRRWEPQRRLGQAYERLGQYDKARAAYARARELRSGH